MAIFTGTGDIINRLDFTGAETRAARRAGLAARHARRRDMEEILRAVAAGEPEPARAARLRALAGHPG
ncbi:MAG: hypothetical protein ACR2KP_05765 [Egibacteraceae bacterium]